MTQSRKFRPVLPVLSVAAALAAGAVQAQDRGQPRTVPLCSLEQELPLGPGVLNRIRARADFEDLLRYASENCAEVALLLADTATATVAGGEGETGAGREGPNPGSYRIGGGGDDDRDQSSGGGDQSDDEGDQSGDGGDQSGDGGDQSGDGGDQSGDGGDQSGDGGDQSGDGGDQNGDGGDQSDDEGDQSDDEDDQSDDEDDGRGGWTKPVRPGETA